MECKVQVALARIWILEVFHLLDLGHALFMVYICLHVVSSTDWMSYN